MNSSLHIILQSVQRIFVGTMLFLIPAALFLLDALSGAGVSEGRCVESAQVCALFLSGVLLALAARCSARRGDGLFHALLCVALGVGLMAIRELDGFFDDAFFHGAWKVFALPFLLAAVAVVCCRRRAWLDSVAALLETRTGFLLELFLLTLCVFSRTFGLKEVWTALFADAPCLELTDEQLPYAARTAKNAVEEVTELFSYMILLAASIMALQEGRASQAIARPSRRASRW